MCVDSQAQGLARPRHPPLTTTMDVEFSDVPLTESSSRWLRWSPDSSRLALVSAGVEIRVFSRRELTEIGLLHPTCRPGAKLAALQWSGDGSLLLTAVEDATFVEVWDTTTWRVVCRLEERVAGIDSAVFVGSQPGSTSLLTVASFRLHATLWSLPSGKSIRLPAPKDSHRCVRWSKRGDCLALAHREVHTDELVVYTNGNLPDAPWVQVCRTPLRTRDCEEIRLCRDDTAVAIRDEPMSGVVHLLSLLTGAELARVSLAHDTAGLRCMAAPAAAARSTTGHFVAFGGLDRTVHLVDVDAGTVMTRHRFPTEVDGATVSVFVEELSSLHPQNQEEEDHGHEYGDGSAPNRSIPPVAAVASATGAAASGTRARLSRTGVPLRPAATATTMRHSVLRAAPGIMRFATDGTAAIGSSAPASASTISVAAVVAAATAAASKLASGLPATGPTSLHWSPCGRFLAWSDESQPGVVFVCGAEGTMLHSVVRVVDRALSLSWRPAMVRPGTDDPSPSLLLIVTATGKLLMVGPAACQAFLLEVGDGVGVRTAVWSPDGTHVVVHSGTQAVLGHLLDDDNHDDTDEGREGDDFPSTEVHAAAGAAVEGDR